MIGEKRKINHLKEGKTGKNKVFLSLCIAESFCVAEENCKRGLSIIAK